MCNPTIKPICSKKRFVELRKLSEELYEWLKLHKVKYEENEVCVLKRLTEELLERD